MKEKPFLLFIGGPTGAGKTAVAIELYQRYGWPIVSADSRQIYRYLDIGTNKIPQAIQAEIPHFLIDVCEPSEAYSAGQFVQAVETLIAGWQAPVVQIVGGTGFYMQALLYGLDAIPPVPPEIRQQTERWLHTEGLPAVVRWLRERDPLTATRIDLTNPRRVQRAVEVLLATGRSLVSFWSGMKAPRYPALQVVLSLPRSDLHKAIAERSRWQVAAGWLEETRFVLERGCAPDAPGLQTLGYRECLAVLQGTLSPEALTEAIIQTNRQYARRQLTWWRSRPYDLWIEDPDPSRRIQTIHDAIEKRLSA